MGAVWTLLVTGMDGIVFWAPILIHTFRDGDSGTGAPLRLFRGAILVPKDPDALKSQGQLQYRCRHMEVLLLAL